MGKRKGAGGGTKPNPPTTNPSFSHSSISLREETTGKLQTKGGSRNSKSFLRLDHLQNLAVWATKEAAVPSLGAFFGRQFAAAAEALGAPPDPNVVSCQRCETILHPGFNCTIRVQKAKPKSRCRRKKKANIAMQNNVVYKCHFCSDCNLKRGTPRGHMKKLCPPKIKSAAKVQLAKPLLPDASTGMNRTSFANVTEKNEMTLPVACADTSTTNSPATPAVRSGNSVLDAKRRQRNKSAAKVPLEMESKSAQADSEQTVSASQKRKRRKSWISLKEIAGENEHGSIQNIANLRVPFFM